jgi:hypothetical protein
MWLSASFIIIFQPSSILNYQLYKKVSNNQNILHGLLFVLIPNEYCLKSPPKIIALMIPYMVFTSRSIFGWMQNS